MTNIDGEKGKIGENGRFGEGFYSHEVEDGMEEKGLMDDFFHGGNYGKKTSSGVSVNPYSAMQVCTIFSCVAMLSEDTAKVRPFLYKKNSNGEIVELGTEHPLGKLLKWPTGKINEGGWITWVEFCTQMTSQLLLYGNSYALLVMNGRKKVIRMVPLAHSQVYLMCDYEGELWWRFSPNGEHESKLLNLNSDLVVPYRNVFHLRNGLTWDGYSGISRIMSGANAIGLGLAQEEISARWMGSHGRISGILETEEQLSPDIVKEIAQRWNQMQSGLKSTGKIAVTDRGLKFKPISMNSVDLEFSEARKFQIEEMARLFRVPRHMLGLPGDGKATAEQLAQDYVNYTIGTITNLWASRMSFTFGLEEEDIFIGFDYSPLLMSNTKTRYDTYRIGVMGMVITPNEARKVEGLPPAEGGDKLVFPSSALPHGTAVSGTSAAGAGKPDANISSDQPDANLN